jgi:hypothetical protein
MAEFYDISNWQEKFHYQTKGTRSKAIVENPQNESLYFFKKSINKYKHEFWSEIIASEIGTELGFNLLNYDIASKNGEIGCISKLMIDINYQQLTEGIDFLQGYDYTYIPDQKESYNKYTFHFIVNALHEYKLEKTVPDLIKTIIFDSIIGNGDRHQENWGYIINTRVKDLKFNNRLMDSVAFKRFVKTVLFIRLIRTSITKKVRLYQLEKFIEDYKGIYSPIYDSGSCLGRELDDNKINDYLTNKELLLTYISKGTSEIRWDGPKLKHFDLIKHIHKEYPDVVESTISSVLMNFNEQNIRKIVLSIDKNLPKELIEHKLPDNRKDLIINLITLRIERLKEIL